MNFLELFGRPRYHRVVEGSGRDSEGRPSTSSDGRESYKDHASSARDSTEKAQEMKISMYELERQPQRFSQHGQRLLWINILLLCSSIIFYGLAMNQVLRHGNPFARNYFLRQVSQPSPLFDLIDIPMKTVRLNGTFVPQDNPSIFRQPPSPEVDAAWERIENQAPIPISRQDVINQGHDPEDAVKFPEEFGFGPDAYIGRIDVLHQIHCLNRIRKHLYWNFDYYYGGEPMTKYHEYHVSHCVYTLLQNLQCTGNVDVYSHFWADAQDNAYPDFSIQHKCRDFDAILAYHDAHQVPLEKFGAIRRPEGHSTHIMSHEFKEAFEWYDDEHPDTGNEVGTDNG